MPLQRVYLLLMGFPFSSFRSSDQVSGSGAAMVLNSPPNLQQLRPIAAHSRCYRAKRTLYSGPSDCQLVVAMLMRSTALGFGDAQARGA